MQIEIHRKRVKEREIRSKIGKEIEICTKREKRERDMQ